jgi:DNA repair protein RecN (Recombination protein N)
MLTHLSLSNLAVYPSLALALPQGLSVLLGEAGTGKSLILSAVAWGLGAAVTAKDVVREGCTQASIELTFSLPTPPAGLLAALHQAGLDDGTLPPPPYTPDAQLELVITRTLPLSGASRFRLNGCLINKATVDALRPWLADCQHQHAALHWCNPAPQQELVDSWLSDDGRTLLPQVAQAVAQWQQLHTQLTQYQVQQAQRHQQLNTLSLQVQQLEAWGITQPDEDDTLKARLHQLSQGEALTRDVTTCLGLLQGDAQEDAATPALRDSLGQLHKRLTHLASKHPPAQAWSDVVAACQAELDTLSYDLNHLADSLEPASPTEVDELMLRLDVLDKAKHLYGPTLADVIATQQQAQAQLAELDWQLHQAPLTPKQVDEAHQHAQALANALTQARTQAGEALCQALQPLLAQLALPHAQLAMVWRKLPSLTAHGQDEVSWQWSANAGEPPKPLHKVASGGELSRLALALAVLQRKQRTALAGVTTDALPLPPLVVLDEIDTGTSGQAAEAMAQQIRHLAQHCQVLMITHQPLVAAAADNMLWLQKLTLPSQGDDPTTLRTVTEGKWLTTAPAQQEALGWLASGRSATGQSETTLTAFAAQLQAQLRQVPSLSDPHPTLSQRERV